MDMNRIGRREFLRLGTAASFSVLGACAAVGQRKEAAGGQAGLILKGGRIATLDKDRPFAAAAAIKDGRFLAVGNEGDVLVYRGPATQVIDLQGRAVIPGLNDSHTHIIRGGLNYNLELRWDGVTSLADAMDMLRKQVERTPPGEWVRVVGGWSEFQFKEKRLPTLEELNAVSREVPIFILHLYDRALLNRAALRASGYTKDTPEPPGAVMERDRAGNPTGLLLAKPNAFILYKTLSLAPKLPPEAQANSTRHFMRELNRLGLTSLIDAGGGFQNYPEDYAVIADLHQRGELTVRIAYNLFTQKPKAERDDFARWTGMVKPGQGDDLYRANGAGEMLVFSASDFEDFREPRPDLPASMESELKAVVKLLAENRWPFRLHATYDESISRFLNVLEEVQRDVPIAGLHWFFDHAETISPRNLERVKALGGGIAVQHRMAYQGEYFVRRYGAEAARRSPPIREMIRLGLPVGMGTDATRVASYNPWVALHWLVTGKTVGGTRLYPEENRLERTEALRLFTLGSSWFSSEEDKKGRIAPGQLADLAVLSADYFSVPEDEIPRIESLLTIVGGKVVHAHGAFSALSPGPIPVLPDWSPVKEFGGYGGKKLNTASAIRGPSHVCSLGGPAEPWTRSDLWGSGCACSVF